MKTTLCIAMTIALLGQRIILPMVPKGTVTSPGNVLQASDIAFDGYIKVPQVDYAWSGQGGATGRIVGGHRHLLFAGFWGPQPGNSFQHVFEVDVNGLTPNTSLGSAPTAALYADWGDPGHGQQQSWDGSCNPLVFGSGNAIMTGLYYNPSNGILYHNYIDTYTTPYDYNVMAATLDSVVGTTGSTTVVGGPWRFLETQQYNGNPAIGIRSSFIAMDPRDGTMLVGGGGYANLAKPWGPNLYGGRAFPTGSDPSGCGSPLITSPHAYLDYYPPMAGYPSGTPGQIDPWTGLLTAGSIGEFKWPTSFLTYVFQRGGHEATQINPSTGYNTFNDISSMAYLGFFYGTHKTGVIYGLGLPASSDSNPTHCSSGVGGTPATAAMTTYLTGQDGGFMHFATASGTPTGTLTGQSSGVSLLVNNLTSWANHQVIEFQNRTGVFTTGETFTGSGFTGSMDFWKTSEVFDNPTITSGRVVGCTCNNYPDLCATGPSTTYIGAAIAVYDPADLEQVKNNTAADYNQTPTTLINLRAAPYNMTDVKTYRPAGPAIMGGWIDQASNKLYVLFGQQIIVPGQGDLPIIGVFSLNDSAPPAPFPTSLYALAALLTGWALLKEKKIA